jgi:serine/threonine-protein kinase
MVGQYRIEAKVGQGAMGVVYGAVHPLIGKRAAVKVMRPMLQGEEGAERFLQEARAVGTLGHPNIVDAFGFGKLDDGRCYFVMEWLQGESLGERLRQGRPSVEDVAEIVDQVCRALDAAHSHGIIHRDLKPDNVFLQHGADDRPQVKLLYFSVAKLADEEARLPITKTGVVIGTPAYVSPEQVRGVAVDGRADIYALGVMSFEMLSGRLPFSPAEKMALLHMHLSEAPPRVSNVNPGVPAALDDVVARMLAKAPEERPSLRDIRGVVAPFRGEAAASHRTPTSMTPVTITPTPMTPPYVVQLSGELVEPAVPAPEPSSHVTETIAIADVDRRRVLLAAVVGVVALIVATIGLSREETGVFLSPSPAAASPPAPAPAPVAAAAAPTPPAATQPPPTVEALPVEEPQRLRQTQRPPTQGHKGRGKKDGKRRRALDF